MSDRLNDELLSAYLDNEVTDEERAQVEQALVDSAEARMSLASLRQIQASLRSVPRLTLPADFQERVIREAERRGARRAVATTVRSVRATQWIRVAAVATTIAAALVVGVVIAISRQAPEIVEVPAPAPSSRDVARDETPAVPDGVAQPDTPPASDVVHDNPPLPDETVVAEAQGRPLPPLIMVFDLAITKQGQRQDVFEQTLKQAGIAFDPRQEGVVVEEKLRKPLLDTRYLVDTAPLGKGNEQFDIIDMLYLQGTGVQIDEIFSKLRSHQEARLFLDLALDEVKETRVLNSIGEQTWSLAKSVAPAAPRSYAYRLNVGISLQTASRAGFLAKFPAPRLDIGIQNGSQSEPKSGFSLELPLGFGGQRTVLEKAAGNPAAGNAGVAAPDLPFFEILVIRRHLDGGFPVDAPEPPAN